MSLIVVSHLPHRIQPPVGGSKPLHPPGRWLRVVALTLGLVVLAWTGWLAWNTWGLLP